MSDKGSAGPTVSVVIPCFNLGAYLDETVQSVLDQTYQDFEIVVVDDGSTDSATRHLFTSYQRPRTRVIRTENRGLAAARNLGISETRGHYVSCLDADDILEPAFLERTVATLDSNPDIAFASCWLKAFGDVSFLWNPTRCDFPHLLAEDTVCTAALTRREALESVGEYDTGMPVAGYEDWDLAIGMVERGLVGRIITEYLFRYRIRAGSMGRSCREPESHSRLFAYIVDKHAASYRQHLPGVLEAIERRSQELERWRPVAPTESAPQLIRRAGFLERTLRAVLESGTWRRTRPARRLLDSIKSVRRQQAPSARSGPRLSVVIAVGDQPDALTAAFDSVSAQTSDADEILFVDGGSTNPIIRHLLDGYRASGFAVLETDRIGSAAARRVGLAAASGRYLFAMGDAQRVGPDAIPSALAFLESDPSLSFVLCALAVGDGSGFRWFPPSGDLPGLLSSSRLVFPIVRRESYMSCGGYDSGLPTAEHGDSDLALRLAAAGGRGHVLADRVVEFHGGWPSDSGAYPLLAPELLRKHATSFELHWREAVLGREAERRRLEAAVWDPFFLASQKSVPTIDWGDLRRTEPVSRVWGLDRGLPVDRYYIARFLEEHRADIRGRVLEVKDAGYTAAYGSTVEKSDVVDIAPDNPSATMVADLSAPASLPQERWDCFVLTQTIHIIYDTRSVLSNAFRALAPGGVLLATLPCVSRLDYESGLDGDFWRFTPASARRLFEEAFGKGNVEVETYGSVLACSAFLQGIAAEELTREELDRRDPYFPLLLCVRAVKRSAADEEQLPPDSVSPARRAGDDSRAVVLLYHRIASSERDRWRLCVSVENFAHQMKRLSARAELSSISRIARSLEAGQLPHAAVAVTFDDGYRDNLTAAVPILRGHRIPATFFLSGDGASFRGSFWWEVLGASMDALGLSESDARELHRRFMRAPEKERRRLFDELPAAMDSFPPRLTRDEIRGLAGDELFEIAAHGWSHRALGEMTPEEQRRDIEYNVRDLTETTGLPVTSFAYPFGGPYTAETIEILRGAGIRAACTVAGEAVTIATDPMEIPRLEVGDWSGEELEERIERLLEASARARLDV